MSSTALSAPRKTGSRKLSRMALATINSLIGEALDSAGANAPSIRNIVVSGNTTMAHLLLQIEPRYIRRDPYIPTVSDFPILKAGEIGLKANPMAAVFIMPGPASYVGGDIVSGVLYTGFHREDPITLYIDIGTNGEIVLGNREWLMTAACSAGPAFEGGGIRWGMRAEEGAIEKVTIDAQTLEPGISTVENLACPGHLRVGDDRPDRRIDAYRHCRSQRSVFARSIDHRTNPHAWRRDGLRLGLFR
jgi:uncharacterized 2Fe-2S/4Fe-4S cluster protein (DUF4445 family)